MNKIKEGFCCEEYRIAYQNGISDVDKVPMISDPFTYRDACHYCGKDPNKYNNK